MKIVVNQKNLKQALGITEKIVAKNTSLPILNNILIKTENGRLKLSATNLEIGINMSVGAKIDEVGEIAVPARILNDFISAVTDEKITLTTKNNILGINSQNYKTNILGFDPKDFPIIPKLKTPAVASINTRSLKNGLITILDSVAISEARPELAGAYIQINNNKATFASTDIFRLTETIIPFKGNDQLSFILPRNTITELIRIAGELEGELQIKYSDNKIVFLNDDFELVSRVVDGTFPDYKKVIPEKFVSRLLIKKEDLEKNTRLAGLFSSNISDIKLGCTEDTLLITAKNSDKGEIETTVPAILKNDPFEISLNYQYLLDGLKNIATSDVVLEYTGPGSPLVIRPSDLNGMVYLIMPLRT